MTRKFGVLLLVGPGEKEIARARDLVDALETYEPGKFRLIIVDDDLIGRQLAPKIAPSSGTTSVEILNPRRGKASGWDSGCAAGVLAALKSALEIGELDFVLKVDTDSLVIRSFSNEILSRFREYPRIGMLGSYEYSPNRSFYRAENWPAAPALEKLLRQLTLWRRTSGGGPMVQFALYGKFKRIRDTIRSALLAGYRLGEHCSGGGYAISSVCLRTLNSAGFLENPCLWLYTPLGEDVVVSMCVRAAGLLLQDFNLDGEPFGVRHQGLLDSPERMLARGFGIIHSVKDYGDQREDDIRHFFRQRRERAGSI